MFATRTARRTARERQQAVLGDCARRFPGLAPLFTVKPKTNHAITHRAGHDELPPHFATLQHHLTSNDNNNPTTTMATHVQHVVHPAQAALLAANSIATPPVPSPSPVHQVPTILVTIQPHAALTPQEVAKHTLLRQIGLLPRGTPEEIRARQARMEENKRNAQIKNQRLERKRITKAKNVTDQLLKHVKGCRVEKHKLENTLTRKTTTKEKAVDGDEEDGGGNGGEELWS